MLDWMFIMFVMLALLFLFLSIFIPEDKYEEPYWKLIFIVVSTVIWFILALMNNNIQTPYAAYNGITDTTTMMYDTYEDLSNVYFTYFYGLMAVLNIIYIIVLVFGYYYEKLDREQQKSHEGLE